MDIDPVDLEIGIPNVKTIINGMTITCDSKEGTEKLREEVENKLGKQYGVKQIQKVKTKIKIISIEQTITKLSLMRMMNHQNSVVGCENHSV